MSKTLNGQCLCGAVTFTATPPKMEMGVCHCDMCRRWSGGAWMSADGGDVTWSGADALGAYKSSEWGERLFCNRCGTTLGWRMQDKSMTMVSVQALEDPSALDFTTEIYVDHKPANYAFANETQKMTEAEFLAMLQAQGLLPDGEPKHG